MKTIGIILTILAFSFSACKKHPSIPSYTTPVNDTITQMVFDTGSWWVYQRMSDNSLDTVSVKSLTRDVAKYIDGKQGYNIEYYKAVYHIASNGSEYACYYYMDRAKFNCELPKLIQTGQEYFFTNDLNGQGKETNAHCCYLTNKELYKDFNGLHFTTVRYFEILSFCQWNTNLLEDGTNYYFNKDVGFLKFYLAGGLGWSQDFYTIKAYHVNHI